MIKDTLLKLGLTKNEVEIYLALLSSGEISVNEIGSKAGLHRQVCYDALDRLVEKGFVSYITKNSKKFFKPLKPEKLLDYLDESAFEFTFDDFESESFCAEFLPNPFCTHLLIKAIAPLIFPLFLSFWRNWRWRDS